MTEAPALPARPPLAGRVVTGDALSCPRALCQQIQGAAGDSVLIVKDHYPTRRRAVQTV